MNFQKIQYATIFMLGVSLMGTHAHATTLGPIGGDAASEFDHREDGQKPIRRIKIWHGDIFDRMQIYYGRKKLGTCNPSADNFNADFKISPNDPIVKVSGVYGNWYGAIHLAKVVFKTRKGKYFGPFGSGNGMYSQTPFSLTAPADEKIQAFFGGCFPHSYDAIFISLLGAETQEIVHRAAKIPEIKTPEK